VIVADSVNRCILLLDAQLTLRRVIMDRLQLNDKSPARMCYSEKNWATDGWVSGEMRRRV